MAYQEERRFTFTCSALPEETFSVVSFKGIEGISRLYEFDITLVAEDPEIDIGTVLKNSVLFKIVHDEGEELFHGIPAYFELLKEADEKVFYRTLLVPRLWMSDQQHENQLFLDKSVPEIIEEIFKQAALSSGKDYEFKLTGQYRSWEYICQYRETDFNFISRWMEREGIYYFFEQTDAGEKIIVTDKLTVHEDLSSDSVIYYSPPSALLPTEEEAIEEFICHQKRLPKKVILKDYNYRKPSLEMTGEAVVDPNSRGIVYLYGEHFKTPEEGNALAKTRAEEILCREKLYFGQSTAPSIRSGFLFTLEDHYKQSCNQKYLVTEVEHEGRQTGFMVSGLEEMMGEEEAELVYRSRFTAIPADVQFRPERQAEKPRFYGTMNARIDASGDGQYAEIDEWGRYKVVLPFDMTGKGGGKASRWIRMAQPYAGAGFGMHFPLHKGTEVLLTFIDGDPDRPIIAGSVPNPENQSPVTGDNHTQCVIRTGGGNQIHTEDKAGKQLIKMSCPTEESFIRIGAPNSEVPPGLHLNSNNQLTTDIGNHAVTRIGNNYITKIGGDEYRVITGNVQREFHSNSHKITKGNQFEEIYGSKQSVKLSTEQEYTAGAKLSICAALSAELKYGHFVTKAPTEYELKEGSIEKKVDLEKMIGEIKEKIGNIKSNVGNMDEKIAKFNSHISNANQKIADLAMEIGSLKQKIASAKIRVSGAYSLKASTFSAKAGNSRLALGSGVTLSGQPIRIKGSPVKINGTTLKVL